MLNTVKHLCSDAHTLGYSLYVYPVTVHSVPLPGEAGVSRGFTGLCSRALAGCLRFVRIFWIPHSFYGFDKTVECGLSVLSVKHGFSCRWDFCRR